MSWSLNSSCSTVNLLTTLHIHTALWPLNAFKPSTFWLTGNLFLTAWVKHELRNTLDECVNHYSTQALNPKCWYNLFKTSTTTSFFLLHHFPSKNKLHIQTDVRTVLQRTNWRECNGDDTMCAGRMWLLFIYWNSFHCGIRTTNNKNTVAHRLVGPHIFNTLAGFAS